MSCYEGELLLSTPTRAESEEQQCQLWWDLPVRGEECLVRCIPYLMPTPPPPNQCPGSVDSARIGLRSAVGRAGTSRLLAIATMLGLLQRMPPATLLARR